MDGSPLRPTSLWRRTLPRGLAHQEAAGQLMHGWLLVLTLVNLALANAIVRLVVAMG